MEDIYLSLSANNAGVMPEILPKNPLKKHSEYCEHSLATNALLLTYKILKFTLKHFFTVTPTCFGPYGPSSGSLR